jgi:hypothetical protein
MYGRPGAWTAMEHLGKERGKKPGENPRFSWFEQDISLEKKERLLQNWRFKNQRL